jgi:hypothetical protein
MGTDLLGHMHVIVAHRVAHSAPRTLPRTHAQVSSRGPIACVLDAGPLNNYTNGIVGSAFPSSGLPDHVVSVFGWGEEAGVKYW